MFDVPVDPTRPGVPPPPPPPGTVPPPGWERPPHEEVLEQLRRIEERLARIEGKLGV